MERLGVSHYRPVYRPVCTGLVQLCILISSDIYIFDVSLLLEPNDLLISLEV